MANTAVVRKRTATDIPFGTTNVVDDMLAPELTGEQFQDIWGRNGTRLPKSSEVGLCLDLLWDAITCLRGKAGGSRRKKAMEQRDSLAWVNSDDELNTYSFVNICGLLKIDVSNVRRRLQRIAEQCEVRLPPDKRKLKGKKRKKTDAPMEPAFELPALTEPIWSASNPWPVSYKPRPHLVIVKRRRPSLRAVAGGRPNTRPTNIRLACWTIEPEYPMFLAKRRS